MKTILSAIIIFFIINSFGFSNEIDKTEKSRLTIITTTEKFGKISDENRLMNNSLTRDEEDESENSGLSFVPGLYIEGTTLGHTLWTTGLGLTFFDQVVKLQVYAGMAPAAGRISGLNSGIKLFANILTIPFDFFLGQDWEFFSIETALGAGLSYFSNTGEVIELSGDNSKLLGIVLAQIGIKLRFRQLPIFNTYSLFTEIAGAFIPSDVPGASTLVPKISFGLRIGIF